MNSAQAEKLKALIQQSSILNEAERREWRSLLELMNDKQAAELEKILESNNALSLNNLKPEPSKPVVAPAGSPKPLEPPKLQPNLSHIMNLPKHWQDSRIARQAGPKAPAASTFSNLSKPLGKFAKKLEAMVKEKELPSGHPVEPLEITAAQVKEKIVAPVSVPAPASTEIKKQPEPEKKVTTQKLAPPIPVAPAEDRPIISLKTVVRPVEQVGPKPTMASVSQMGDGRTGVLGGIEPDAKAQFKNLQKLEDLATLDKTNFDADLLDKTVAAIKALMMKFGYHQVIFNLEKSPLYVLYISTGRALLKDNLSFEDLQGQGYLSKTKFESFVDLLRKVRSA